MGTFHSYWNQKFGKFENGQKCYSLDISWKSSQKIQKLLNFRKANHSTKNHKNSEQKIPGKYFPGKNFPKILVLQDYPLFQKCKKMLFQLSLKTYTNRYSNWYFRMESTPWVKWIILTPLVGSLSTCAVSKWIWRLSGESKEIIHTGQMKPWWT